MRFVEEDMRAKLASTSALMQGFSVNNDTKSWNQRVKQGNDYYDHHEQPVNPSAAKN